jgi:hypothetical protein
MSDDAREIKEALIARRPQMVALRPERAFVVPRAETFDTETRDWIRFVGGVAGTPADWTIGSIGVVPIVAPCILCDLYTHRGRRVVGRKIRQMRRRFRRNFDPTYARYTP